MRKFLIAVGLLLGVVFFLTRIAELEKILEVLQRGNFWFLGLALLLQFGWLWNLSAFYKALYRVLGIEERQTYLIKLVTAANFLATVAPSAGLSGMAIFISDARRKNRSTGKVTVAGVLYIWFEYLGILAVALLGLAELSRRNSLGWPEITAWFIMLAGVLLIGLLLFQGIKSPPVLARTLHRLANQVNSLLRPIIGRNYLSEERAETFTRDIAEGLGALRTRPHWAAWLVVYTLLNKVLLFSIMYLCFLAFQVPVNTSAVVVGISIDQLFLIVSPTPSGVGIVEGMVAVTLSSLNVLLHDATVIALAYRAYSFWTPLLVGMISLRLLDRQNPTIDRNSQSINNTAQEYPRLEQ